MSNFTFILRLWQCRIFPKFSRLCRNPLFLSEPIYIYVLQWGFHTGWLDDCLDHEIKVVGLFS